MIQPPYTEADQRAITLEAMENRQARDQRIETQFVTPPMTEDEYLANSGRHRHTDTGERPLPDEPKRP